MPQQTGVVQMTPDQIRAQFESYLAKYPDGPLKDSLRSQLAQRLEQFPEGVTLPLATQQSEQSEQQLQASYAVTPPHSAEPSAAAPVAGERLTRSQRRRRSRRRAAGASGPTAPEPVHASAPEPAPTPQHADQSTIDILTEAHSVIYGEREDSYGHPRESFGRIAALWSGYLGQDVSPLDVANLMVLLKVSRARHGFHRDSYVDMAGYAASAERIAS